MDDTQTSWCHTGADIGWRYTREMWPNCVLNRQVSTAPAKATSYMRHHQCTTWFGDDIYLAENGDEVSLADIRIAIPFNFEMIFREGRKDNAFRRPRGIMEEIGGIGTAYVELTYPNPTAKPCPTNAR